MGHPVPAFYKWISGQLLNDRRTEHEISQISVPTRKAEIHDFQ
jgi:hypothetical protein